MLPKIGCTRTCRIGMPLILTFAACCLAPASASAEAPRVIKAGPDDGDQSVDPKVKELRVEFDQDMDTRGGYSFCGGGPTFPKTTGKARWKGRRTILLPIQLEPNHSYALSINCPAAQNFRSAGGESAVPYPIRFKTRGENETEAAKLTPETNRKAFAALKKALTEQYAYHDLRKLDWKKTFSDNKSKLEQAETPIAFAKVAGKMLAPANDLHLYFRVGDVIIPTATRSVPAKMNIKSLAKAVPDWTQVNDVIYTGRFNDGIGYLLIATWGPADPALLDAAYDALSDFADCEALIVDVRPNSGGDEILARNFAGCFVAKSAVYSHNQYRDPAGKDGFGKVLDRVIEPTKGRPRFRKPTAVLMGPQNMSSCESFLLMMKQAKGCVLVGEKSWGSSGNPKPFDLGNGVTALIPSWKDLLPDGTVLEARGIEPDVAVPAKPADFEKRDPVLDAALKHLRKTIADGK